MMRTALVDKPGKMQDRLVDKSRILQGPLLLVVLALAGCGAVPRVEVQEVKVPVPVECREPIPDRPSMPTEALAEDAGPFELLRAALAEIDRREGYEVRLLVALMACTAPLPPR
jgi:hypothetical protein